MHLRRLQANNFRNLTPLDLALNQAPVVIWGENGQGKSNLLEAIILACTGALWRASRDEEAIGWGQDIARVKAEVQRPDESELITEVALARSQKPLFKINGVARRRSDLLGLIPVVAFSNEDLQIIKGEPSQRRQFLNSEISQLSRSYHWNLTHYNRSLEQRNRLLKDIREGRSAPGNLTPWDDALARYGAKLVERRYHFLGELQLAADLHLSRLHPGWAPLALVYRPALGNSLAQRWESLTAKTPHQIEALLLEGLQQSREEEIARGFSLVGPHRDDFELLMSNVDQRIFGSQGQQRSTIIALRLGLADLIEQSAGERPLLLLDDVFSELDLGRRQGLFDALGPGEQFFLTTPTIEEVPDSFLAQGQLFRLHQGQVSAGRPRELLSEL